MPKKNGKIIIANNIRLDKGHNEVLDYTEEQMVNLVRANKIDEANDYSFIRDNGSISVHFAYDDCLQASYMAFQNTDYANKWFFAFVDDVKFIAEGTTQIFYTVDSWATFFNDVNIIDSFVIREHTNDDTVGANTLPENFETGEYIINDLDTIDNEDGMTNTYICIAVSWIPDELDFISDDRRYGGVYSGLYYLVLSVPRDASKLIRAYDKLAKADAIYSVFLAPRSLFGNLTFEDVDIEGETDISIAYPQSTNFSDVLVSGLEISSPNTLNGYSPKNNKLFTYPYNYLYITNNNGSDVIYNYEDFVNNLPKFSIDGVLTTGCSIRLHPNNYKKYSTFTNYPKMESCFGITAGKYPTCSWQSDAYTNWLTQNAVNIPLQIAGSVLSIGSGIATQNPSQATSGLLSIGNTISTIYQHSLVPEQAKGNINSGDVIYGMRMNLFTYYKMSIKQEYARCIDEYFTKYGYKTNRNKIPNITGRRYWNYIQISSDDILGYGSIPNKFMDEINNIARKGTTIWHDHANIGNYSLNNTIV